jgi:hypothetical protein
MRTLLALLLALCLGGCVNGFEKYYSPAPGSEKIPSLPTVEKPPEEPRIYPHSGDLKADFKGMAENGYILIGTSSFVGPSSQVKKGQAVAEGKRVGAAVVLVHSAHWDTLSGSMPYTVQNPTQYATVNTTGSMNAYGTGGYATGTYNSMSTIAMPGGSTTYNIPYNIPRDEFFASYWAKQDPTKMRLGIRYLPLPDDVRNRLQRNTGVFVPIVVQGTPAFRANILEGDVIVKVNGQDVIDTPGFEKQLTAFAGKTVEFSIIRGTEPKDIKVTLNPNPPGVQ